MTDSYFLPEEMFADIKNKSALVTGTSRGIGKAISTILQDKGARVYGVSRSEKETIKINSPKMKDGTSETRGTFIPLQADLSQEQEIQQVASKIDTIDILVHNAAYFQLTPFEQLTRDQWEQHIMLNLTTPFLLTRALWDKLKKPSGAESSIVFISSLAGVQNKEKFPETSAYVASKMGLVGLSEAIAVEGKAFNIRSNSISPGAVNTPMLQSAFPSMKADFNPQEIARMVLYYASSSSSPITGTNIIIQS